ncbi:hypothetical protein BO70DRAFT_98789 [Aspergillus heteromorphus CBS 117.55]|uniref:Uncharacterized protein n=1 Tax=Aspergillus heteromorphus CBS 117.55 TaxID=1448321 RepID=A0A317VR95_9EURO|nr:uncharacterized protein BO70DRAFT_98789 [Aspergillus heteromorphus CBS 117.55]PWY75537.1 hypothetical protein BO70DRAFT_98789 [Aspergillus heteromorphus CBS 117.55]
MNGNPNRSIQCTHRKRLEGGRQAVRQAGGGTRGWALGRLVRRGRREGDEGEVKFGRSTSGARALAASGSGLPLGWLGAWKGHPRTNVNDPSLTTAIDSIDPAREPKVPLFTRVGIPVNGGAFATKGQHDRDRGNTQGSQKRPLNNNLPF